MRPRIKVCGLTNLADAQLAAELGADALGFIFYAASKRAISRETAAPICAALPPLVTKVGVFVNATAEEIQQTVRECRLSAIQLHGDESPAFCRQFGLPTIKAIRVRDAASLAVATEYQVDALLLDTYSTTQLGGTGQSFDWSLAVQAKRFGRPIILSGGLTAENVAAAIATVQPYAVDVASGVESAPGRKDVARIRDFIQAARSA